MGVEDHHAHRRGLDQGLEAGPGPALVAVGLGVGDGGRGLGGEQDQDLVVRGGELRAALLVAEEEVADVDAAVPHRRAVQGAAGHPVGGEAERADVGVQVGQPERGVQVAEVLEQPRPVGPVGQAGLLFGGEAGGEEVGDPAGVVDRGDHAVARAGQGAGAADDLLQDGVEVEAGADAQDGGDQRGEALAEGLDLLLPWVGVVCFH